MYSKVPDRRQNLIRSVTATLSYPPVYTQDPPQDGGGESRAHGNI